MSVLWRLSTRSSKLLRMLCSLVVARRLRVTLVLLPVPRWLAAGGYGGIRDKQLRRLSEGPWLSPPQDFASKVYSTIPTVVKNRGCASGLREPGLAICQGQVGSSHGAWRLR